MESHCSFPNKSNFIFNTSIIIISILEYHQLSTEAKVDILWYWESLGKEMDDGWWNPTNDDEDDTGNDDEESGDDDYDDYYWVYY